MGGVFCVFFVYFRLNTALWWPIDDYVCWCVSDVGVVVGSSGLGYCPYPRCEQAGTIRGLLSGEGGRKEKVIEREKPKTIGSKTIHKKGQNNNNKREYRTEKQTQKKTTTKSYKRIINTKGPTVCVNDNNGVGWWEKGKNFVIYI